MGALFAGGRRPLHVLGAAALALGLSGCAAMHDGGPRTFIEEPRTTTRTFAEYQLHALPPPPSRVAVAVYNYSDQTGQFKPTDNVQTLSRAVTQGATSMLVEALEDAGQRSWFMVIERERIDNLMKERQIIREMRQRYLGEEQVNPQALPPLLFAGILLEGGIIGFDSNTLTGGAGARYLGIGASTKYRQDTVTVYLRAVSVKTGEVLASVSAKKTIASFAVSADAFRYVAFRELLEAETGFTTNEPDQLALRQAIEKAVHMMVLEGVDLGLWAFADPEAGKALIEQHRREQMGVGPDDPTPPPPLRFASGAAIPLPMAPPQRLAQAKPAPEAALPETPTPAPAPQQPLAMAAPPVLRIELPSYAPVVGPGADIAAFSPDLDFIQEE
jgi:curli production assembly/transport component CsgG